MAEKYQKRPSRHGREHLGCVSSLINIFDFRRARSTKRLLTDLRPSVRGDLSDETGHDDVCESKEDAEKKEKSMSENAKISVKELMEEEMFDEGGMKNLPKNSQICAGEITSNSPKKISVSKLDTTKCSFERKTFDKLVYDTIVEHLVGISTENSAKNDFISVLDMLSTQAVTITDKKLIASVKLIMEQKVGNLRNYGESPSHEEFKDSVNTLTANYGLFLELLQALNSFQASSSLPVSNLLHEKPVSTKSRHKNKKFFRRRSRSLESFLQLGNEDHHSSLAILKSGSVVTQNLKTDAALSGASFLSLYMYNKEKNERCTSLRFSFTELKRKLWHALVKEKSVIFSEYSPTYRNMKTNGWSSPNRNHFYNERFILSPGKNGEQNLKLKESISQCQSLGGFNLYIEAKKHISEMLKNVDEDSNSRIKRLPMSLSMILASPTHSTSPGSSPIEFDHKNSSKTSRDESGAILQEDHGNNSCSVGEARTTKGEDADDGKEKSVRTHSCILFKDNEQSTLEIHSFYQGDTIDQEIGKSAESRPEIEGEIIKAVYESGCGLSDGDFQLEGNTEPTIEDSFHQLLESSTCLRSDFSEEDKSFSSSEVSTSHSTVTIKAEVCGHAMDKLEQPSPVSVLDPLFVDDTSSPASIASGDPVMEVEPRHLNFEELSCAPEQGICTRISMEDEETPFEYLETVLLGSGLDWDEFHLRWLYSNEILDASLFNEVELFSNRSHDDQRLLFDYANEALTSVCDIYFGKANIQSIPSSMELIDHIWRSVEWHLFRQRQVNSMDELVRMDLTTTGKWTKVERDIEHIGFEIEVKIFDVLMEDTILSFLELCSHQETKESSTAKEDTIL